jgi:hypothetical protein
MIYCAPLPRDGAGCTVYWVRSAIPLSAASAVAVLCLYLTSAPQRRVGRPKYLGAILVAPSLSLSGTLGAREEEESKHTLCSR